MKGCYIKGHDEYRNTSFNKATDKNTLAILLSPWASGVNLGDSCYGPSGTDGHRSACTGRLASPSTDHFMLIIFCNLIRYDKVLAQNEYKITWYILIVLKILHRNNKDSGSIT